MLTVLRRRGAALAATLVALAAAGPAAAEKLEKTLQNSYPLAAGGQVVVENVNGEVVVESWDRAEVRVRATKKVRAGSAAEAAEAMERLKVHVETGADSLRIATSRRGEENGFFDWIRGRQVQGSVSYHLTVPRGVRLVAGTVNGGIALRGIEGQISASTTNGSVRIEEARGHVEASTTNGSIRAELAAVTANAEMSFATTNGAVTLTLPEDVATTLRLRTTNGGIEVDFPIEAEARKNRRQVDADLNGGGGTVRVSTTNGSIAIKRG